MRRHLPLVLVGLALGLGSGCGSPSNPNDGGAGGQGGGAGGHGGGAGGSAGGHGGGAAGSSGGGGAGGVAGTGGRGGSVGFGGAGGVSGTICGGFRGAQCSALEWCDYGDSSCGVADQSGVCQPRDATGFDCSSPVCGCNGNAYRSACSAHQAGVDTMATTSCIPGNGGDGVPCGADTDCATGFKCCVTGGAVGSPIACRQIPSGGQCPALP